MSVDVTDKGEDALWMAGSTEYDAIVLDVMLPGIDGFETCRKLRDDGVWSPVLMLTARDAVEDRVAGLDGGADDYLTKPFSFEELLARVRAVARRAPIPRPPVLKVEHLKLDPATHEVWRGRRKLNLTPREFQILELLMRREGTVLSRDAIIEGVWGHTVDVEMNTVDVFLSTLRGKVDGPQDQPLIHTVRGVGFYVKVPEP
jgi:two-component system OmpR family response regulator